MYRVQAETVDEYFNAGGDRKQSLIEIDRHITENAPQLTRWFYNVSADQPGMTFKMISYGKFSYAHTAQAIVEWPVIGVALQKNYLSVYVSITKNGKPILDYYRDRLRCLRSGNNNFSFEDFHDLDVTVLGELIVEIGQIFAKDPSNPVKFKENR